MAESEMEISAKSGEGPSGLDGLRKRTRTAVEEIASELEKLNAKGFRRFSSSAEKDLLAVERAFSGLKKSITDLPRIEPLSDGFLAGEEERMKRLKDMSRFQMEERERLLSEEAALTGGHLRETEEMERASWATRLMYAQTAASMLSNTLQNLFIATGSKNRAMFEAMKAFAIAETVIQTYRAAQGAYAALAPIPVVGPALGAAAAAAAIAAGLARVEQIRSTTPKGATSSISTGGRANPQYSGGSPGAYPVPARLEDERPTQFITIQIYNPLSEQNWQKIIEDNIIPAMRDAGDRNISLSMSTM
ncbi:MAG: hypothetical protein H3C68_08145 [Deltaproteobacteria bacterium]|nr:hypothetical protein [Deltaproteobacteria bacterium]MBZ0219338.1 hypothetical protein [Deltaproteobacteria bacterium]